MSMFDLGKRGDGGKPATSQEDVKMQDRETTATPAAQGSSQATGGRGAAVIGPSIHIEGTLRGGEDLVIEGQISGRVHLPENSLTIGPKGRLKAEVYAHTVYVEGSVDGDLYGADRIVIRKSAEIRGNLMAPRVALEEGARFKGAIEMDSKSVESAMNKAKQASAAETSASGGGAAAPAETKTTGSGSQAKPTAEAAGGKGGA
ncbi:polymer-forming cytoskeletal protein [Methylonatrum kenyense]|uniref:bactofilin family protein n=1 Tax=Methylonatrum kenyense TaxID=455253 RepID=UPI0020BF7921|nr:polymer-forming cytoskeletal protein [Methylonatrum kenyense]MCK8514871.1 polymer-forming cytoskeletal protein [Methylonatrum kenyense]